MTTEEKYNQVLNKCLHDLGEEFEAVQILATKTEEGNTLTVCRSVGNWHARVGLAHAMIDNERAMENALQIAAEMKEE